LSAGSDSIDLNVKFEISNFLGENRGGVTTSRNNVDTQVIVRSSQSAAIGGLVSNTSNTGFNRQPASSGSGDVLFNLLSSKAFRREQSQFVVFITPVIKTSASAGSEQVKKKFRLRD